jgi:Phosphotransacetylase
MSKFITDLKNNLNGENIKIVFPEGTDKRILTAAAEHLKNSYVHPIVSGMLMNLRKLRTKKILI